MYFFETMVLVFFNTYSEVELLDHMVALEEPLYCSVVSVAICTPTNSVGGFAFLNILTNICYLCTSLFVFFKICISLMIKDAEHLFMCCY